MKILHVIQTLDPATGGLPAVAVRLAAAQASLGHEVHVLSYQTPGAERAVEQSCAEVPGIEAVRLHQLQPGRVFERLFAGNVRHELRTLLSDCCVVHLHGVWDSILRVAAREARRRGVPYVVTPHGMLDPWSLQQRSWKKKLALALGYRKMLNRAGFLHALNRDEQQLLGPLRLTCPVEVIPNGIFLEEIPEAPAANSFRERIGVPHDPIVLFLSRLHYKKGLDHLAAAFALLAKRRADVHLVVAGPDGGARTAFEEQIRACGLLNRVHVVGPLYGREKFAALHGADCYCLPSRQEGFSIAVLEALVYRLPVVISASCHFPEVAEVGAGHVTELDPEALASAMQKVLDSDHAKSVMGAAGRKLVETRFTWPRVAERSIAAYERVLAGPKGSAM